MSDIEELGGEARSDAAAEAKRQAGVCLEDGCGEVPHEDGSGFCTEHFDHGGCEPKDGQPFCWVDDQSCIDSQVEQVAEDRASAAECGG